MGTAPLRVQTWWNQGTASSLVPLKISSKDIFCVMMMMSFGLTSDPYTDNKANTQVSDGESLAINSICGFKPKKPVAHHPQQPVSQSHLNSPVNHVISEPANPR